MSWTRGTRQRGGGGAEGRVGKAISEERDKTATNSSSSSDGGGIAKLERQTGTDKWTRGMEGGQWNGGTERQTNTDGNFLHTNSVTDKQRERGKVSERGRRREQQQQKIQLNIEITNPQLSCAL